jgi:serine/threonine-protein kinase
MAGQSDATSQGARQLIGTRINNYEVKSLLGEGGMGAVFIAEHPMIDRKVAVKVLKREFAENQTLVHRFFNEARAANAIRHPNIIDVLDVGTLPDGLPYLVMPLLEGESLSTRIHRAVRLGVGEALDFAQQTASALAAAHGKGIVHRDLKPDNLFLVPDLETPGRERLKILDFGIAKLSQELSGTGARTGTGAVMGTPPYMSPEQCRGITSEIDGRTDIYALGIILYEMLCGAPPFVSPGFGDVLMMHMTKEPAPPTSINPEIPPHVERAILKALAKRREERFDNMDALRSALRDGSGAEKSARPAPAIQAGQTIALPSAGAAGVGTRPLTTFSSGTGAMETVDGADDVVAPAGSSKRWLAIGGTVAVAAAFVGFFTLGGGKQAPTTGGEPIAAAPSPLPSAASPAPKAEPAPPPSPPVVPAPVQPPAEAAQKPAVPPAAQAVAAEEPETTPRRKDGAKAPRAVKRTVAHRTPASGAPKTEAEVPSNKEAAPPPQAQPPPAAKHPLVF